MRRRRGALLHRQTIVCITGEQRWNPLECHLTHKRDVWTSAESQAQLTKGRRESVRPLHRAVMEKGAEMDPPEEKLEVNRGKINLKKPAESGQKTHRRHQGG